MADGIMNAEIEITPAMLAAGSMALCLYDLSYSDLRECARAVFKAMLSARVVKTPPKPHATPKQKASVSVVVFRPQPPFELAASQLSGRRAVTFGKRPSRPAS